MTIKFIEKRQASWDLTPEYIYFNPSTDKYFEGLLDDEGTVHDVQQDMWSCHYWNTLEEARQAIDKKQRHIIEDIRQCEEPYDFEEEL